MSNRGVLSLSALICAALALPALSFSASPAGDSSQLIAHARAALETGDYTRADDLYTSAIRILEGASVTDGNLASSLVGMGGVRIVQGRCGQGSDLALRGIEILQAAPLPDPFELSEAWATLGKAYHCQRHYTQAEQAYRHAIDAEQSGPVLRPDRLVELLASQGVVYESERKFTDAENSFQRAQSVINRNPQMDANEGALLLNNFGLLLRLMGRGGESEATLRQGLALAEAAPHQDPGLVVYLEQNLATIDVGRKHYQDAAVRYAKAVRLLDLGTALSPRDAAAVLNDYAACLRKLGDRRQAKTLETRAAALLSNQPEGNRRQTVDVAEFARSK